MKTRNEIYQGEGAKLLRFITTYHTLRYDQILQLFSDMSSLSSPLITSLIKQGRIIYDKEHDLLCDSQQSAENPDYAIITCFWVLLDFKKGVVYHTSGEFPIKLNFFSQDEQYEIIYIGEEQGGSDQSCDGKYPITWFQTPDCLRIRKPGCQNHH